MAFYIFFTNTITVKILFQFFAVFLSGQGTGSKTNRRCNQNRLCGICESFLTGLEGNTKYAFVGCDDLGAQFPDEPTFRATK